jgi:acetyl-CoA synthetase
MTDVVTSLCNVEEFAAVNQSFDELCQSFKWNLPSVFNVAEAVCHRHATGHGKLAMIAENESAECVLYTFDQIAACAARLASCMVNAGVKRGDRVAVILPQRVETAVVHLAAQRIGAISLPLSILFGDEALQYRLQDSGTSFLVVADSRFDVINAIRNQLPELHTVLRVSEAGPVAMDAGGCAKQTTASMGGSYSKDDVSLVVEESPAGDTSSSFWQQIAQCEPLSHTVQTAADDPAFLLYTSGTTGPPKGALIPQRALLGNLTGFECSHNGFPKSDDVMYTPADWAWTGGLLDALLPAWYYGVPVVALDYQKFNTECVVSLMSRHKVTCAFIPPTALKMMRREPQVLAKHPMALRSIMSAGESLGETLFLWAKEQWGVPVNEMCGQTEHNYLMGNCSAVMLVKPGSMGKAYPGHRVSIMAPDGVLLPKGETGEIVAHRDDPVHFLGYWNKPEATAEKYTGEWFHTGDVGHIDDEGYLWFHGRADDVISSAGYRIGPGEIENCALSHKAVLQAAAIGVTDPEGLRGEVVKLCVVLREGVVVDESLQRSLKEHIKSHLAAYEYPRLIEFLDELPMTTTGKIQRNVLRRWHEAAQ